MAPSRRSVRASPSLPRYAWIWNGRRGPRIQVWPQLRMRMVDRSSASDARSIRAASRSTCRGSSCTNPTVTGAQQSATASFPDGSI
ncbi:hypothetical protein BRADI_4g13917v3 [Brachypodium distachyon]|uniref:Uncharacterized protein n=1 Tax=Brachypodium distachyon TaxID=15368 RepID=A0A2K2CMP0_BRADI|nr:hypothetical protein BRADI_4g13917v3 [Brachypodium distachyon]PNT63299.1 hypothetical protein BRADI_4g13917v3 [Brachypodium distachyon]PNT63300.1 hypothetical protein BRADI_4g13917v3 [Brachypodium distachyon]